MSKAETLVMFICILNFVLYKYIDSLWYYVPLITGSALVGLLASGRLK